MPAPEGNQYALKLKDPAVRKAAYESYCSHLSKGKSKKSWVFEYEEITLLWESFEKYLKEYDEFDPIKMQAALAKGYQKWEGVCEDSAEGKNKDANTASLQMIMRNKYGWDKKEEQTVSQAPTVYGVNYTNSVVHQNNSEQILPATISTAHHTSAE